MHPVDFLKQLDDGKIVAAIAEAERKTSGEIRVYISHRPRTDALAWARTRFRKLGLHKTKDRNAVLIYLVPRTRSFAIVGDTGVDAKLGAEFWKKVTAQLAADIRTKPMTAALTRAVEAIGDSLAQHFPPSGENKNELPNELGRD